MAGRPSKLTASLVAKAKKYDYTADGDLIPTIEGLALYLNVSRSSVYLWTEDESDLGKQFSDIVNRYLAQQSKLLITNGLAGKFNANITKLILSGKHGYVEQTKQDLTTNGKDLPTPILGGVSVRTNDSDSQAS